MSELVQLLIISFAAFRVWRLLGADIILKGPRDALTRRKNYTHEPGRYRRGLDEFISCPWCLGFWIALAWWGAWYWSPGHTTTVAIPWAISAAVGIIAHNLDS